MSNIIPQITVDEFLSFKTQNVEILLDANEYIKRVGNSNKINKTSKSSTNQKRTHNSYQNYKKQPNWKQQGKGGTGGSFNSNHIQRTKLVTYDNEDDLLYTKFRSLLNKLSSNNINAITSEIKSLNIIKKEHIEKLIDFIFSKAVKENKFTTIYALCVSHMMPYKITLDTGDLTFAELFFKKCKAMFDECLAFDVELEKQYLNEMATKVSKTFNFKDEVIGCVSFVGELYNHKILSDRVITICLNCIMKAFEAKKVYCIDILCNFLKTIGKKFCVDNSETFNAHVKILIQIKDDFNKIERCIIMDLIDYLNKNGISKLKY